MAALLFLSFPAGFSRDATAGDSAGDNEKLTCAGPSSLSESLLALSRLGFWLLCAVIYCIHCIYVHLLFAFIVYTYVCIHIHYSFCLAGCLFFFVGWESVEMSSIPELECSLG